MMNNRENKSEQGFLAAEWVGAVAVLLFPVFMIVISMLQYPPRKSLAQTAASQAARACVQALDQGVAEKSAKQAALDAVQGEASESIISSVTCTYPSYCPGEDATATVSLKLPITIVPYTGVKLFGDAFEVKSSSVARIDDYADVKGADIDAGTCDTP